MTPRERAEACRNDMFASTAPMEETIQRHLEAAIADALVDHYPLADGTGYESAFLLATDICERAGLDLVGNADHRSQYMWMTTEIYKLTSKATKTVLEAAIAEERERCERQAVVHLIGSPGTYPEAIVDSLINKLRSDLEEFLTHVNPIVEEQCGWCLAPEDDDGETVHKESCTWVLAKQEYDRLRRSREAWREYGLAMRDRMTARIGRQGQAVDREIKALAELKALGETIESERAE